VATVDNGPIPRTEGASGYPPNLDALWRGVADQTKPDASKLYFLRRLPRDPFYPDPAAPAAETGGLRSPARPAGPNGGGGAPTPARPTRRRPGATCSMSIRCRPKRA
jgi:general secretion pathway protein G